MSAYTGIAKFVASKPRLVGILFALTLLLVQVGNVAARPSHVTITGP